MNFLGGRGYQISKKDRQMTAAHPHVNFRRIKQGGGVKNRKIEYSN